MPVCGPKLSLCGVVLSAWGIIQLSLMGVFFYIKALSTNKYNVLLWRLRNLEVSTWEYNEFFNVYKQSGSWILVATWHNSMSMTTDVYGWRLRALPWLRISSWTSRTPAWPACVPTWTPATTRTLSTAGSPPCSTWSLFASRRSSSGWTTGQATGEINLVQNHRSHLYRVFRHFIRCLVLQRVRPAGSARVETGKLTENMISVERILYLFHSCD